MFFSWGAVCIFVGAVYFCVGVVPVSVGVVRVLLRRCFLGVVFFMLGWRVLFWRGIFFAGDP